LANKNSNSNSNNEREPFLVVAGDSCPHCGKHDNGFAVGGELWQVCHRHRVRWFFDYDPEPRSRIEWTPELMKLLNYEVVEPARSPVCEVTDLLSAAVAKLERAGQYLRDPHAMRLIAGCRGRVGGNRLREEADRLAEVAAAQQAIILRLVATDAELKDDTRPRERPPEVEQAFSEDSFPF
jgi:hypothetical protein